jgi:glycosyltransferase involved in cell wall biosynthesis
MKVLHVHDFFAPGNSRYGFDMNRLLVRRGHEVHVMAAVGPMGPADGAEIDGVRFHTWPQRPELSSLQKHAYAMRQNETRFEELHAAQGFDVLVLNQPLCAEGVLRSAAARALPKAYWFISPWAAEWKASNPGAHAAARLFHTALRNRMEKAALQEADVVLVESEYIRGLLREHHRKVKAEKVRLVPGAVDLERFRPPGTREEARARLGLGGGRVVLSVRRLVPRMGLDALLEAARELRDVELVIGGEGPMRGELEARAAAAGVRARFLGYVPDAELPWWYRAADVFVLPTRELEGFGLVAIEAMACGTPALGTPVGAIPEVLGPLGLLFEGTAPAQIAARLRRFFAEPDPGLETRCLRRVRECYDWDRVIVMVEQALDEVRRARAGHRRG